MPGNRQYAAPTSIAEAARLMAGEEATLLAGGTDLMPQLRAGTRSLARLLLNVSRLPELKGISQSNGTIRVGALSTVTEIRQDPLLRKTAGILPEVADCFACGQVRNSATLGGNICNASPAGDLIVPLLLLDAEVELASWSGERLVTRQLPLAEFFVGPGATRIAPNEILTAIRFPAPDRDHVAVFRKFGARPAMDIAVVSVGISGRREGEALRDVRVAFGAVAPTPLRGRRTEALVEGEVLSSAVIAKAVRQAREEIAPISDVRASAWYREELIAVLTERLLRDVRTSRD